MGYYDAESVPIFDFFARHFVVCDRWFAPLPTGTQANRLMAMGGESRVLDDVHILPQQDLVYDWLTKNGVRWCAYQSGGMFPFFSLMPSWEAEIATSLAYSLTGGRGRFRLYDRFREEWMDPAPMPQVIFIEPEYTNGPHHDPNDDHPPTGVAKGQAFVSDIYGILIANPARWANTMLIVSYDEHGGFFDHVPPLPIAGSGGGYPFASSGVRVPAFVVSPHVASGKVHSRPLDHTSILQLLADRFTPGRDYSPAVASRQPQLGPLSAVIEPSAALRRPAPAAATVSALNSVAAAAPVPPAAGAHLGDATTAQAFHLLAGRVVRRHPDLPIALNATTPPSVSSPSPSGNT
jgi:phospholipase C